MQTVLIIIVGWIALSCTLGPLLTWAFFYSDRRAKKADAIRDRHTATGPTVTLAPDLPMNRPHASHQTRLILTRDAPPLTE